MYFLAILLLYFSLHPIAGWGTYCLFVYGFILSCIGFKKKVHFPIHLLRILFIFFMPLFNVLLFLFSLGESTAAAGSSDPPLSLSEKICFSLKQFSSVRLSFTDGLIKKLGFQSIKTTNAEGMLCIRLDCTSSFILYFSNHFKKAMVFHEQRNAKKHTHDFYNMRKPSRNRWYAYC
ncbi:hypothetical protein [Bacillus cabrialesii]|uniref:Uncharacterized protein n=1 Tax=Bacillus cabrialesii subsp. tritici TaxID=2944916 RepID=A0ABT9DIM7_9BACI|nr:hypothetical protein [Bacillus cabrialesii]MDO8224551.1 hypothetical protein [Bacillus cabrialesii subsp. tritici]